MTSSLYPINGLVAATDFSKIGNAAVMRGALIAQQTGQVLHLLHIVHPLEIYPELMVTFDIHIKDYERLKHANGIEELDALATEIRKEFNIKVITASRIGRPHTQIVEYVKEHSTDLLVVGYRRERNLLDAVLGSTAIRLLAAAPCAVLMVRDADVLPYREVIASVDLSLISSDIVAAASVVAPSAQIEMLHVFDLKQEILSREVGTSEAQIEKYRESSLQHINDELNKLKSKLESKQITSKVVNGYLPESICSRVETVNADLIVLGKQGKSSLQEFVLGSVSKTVATMVECDVLLT